MGSPGGYNQPSYISNSMDLGLLIYDTYTVRSSCINNKIHAYYSCLWRSLQGEVYGEIYRVKFTGLTWISNVLFWVFDLLHKNSYRLRVVNELYQVINSTSVKYVARLTLSLSYTSKQIPYNILHQNAFEVC